MKKSLLVLSVVSVAAFLSSCNTSDRMVNGMTANQQKQCQDACMARGFKYDPTSASNAKGCTCITSDGDGFTITDPGMEYGMMDNTVDKNPEKPRKLGNTK